MMNTEKISYFVLHQSLINWKTYLLYYPYSNYNWRYRRISFINGEKMYHEKNLTCLFGMILLCSLTFEPMRLFNGR